MKRSNIIINVVKYFSIILIVLITLFPFYSLINVSFKETFSLGGGFSQGTPFTLQNYVDIFEKYPFLRWIINSSIIALSTALIKAFLDTLAGYAFARFKFPGSNFLFGLVLATMMFPAAVTLLPVFKIIAGVNLVNTHIGMILPMIANPFGIFLMRQFMGGIPKSIEESAIIDGCSTVGVFFKIIMPMSRPGQVVVFTIHTMWAWTNLIWPLIIARDESMFPLTVGLATMAVFTKTNWGAIAAASVLSLLPPFIFFMVSQRSFLEGITLGAVKE